MKKNIAGIKALCKYNQKRFALPRGYRFAFTLLNRAGAGFSDHICQG